MQSTWPSPALAIESCDCRMYVIVAGPVASNKCKISAALARQLNANVVSFGSYVREEASRLGRSSDYLALQALGDELIDAQGWQAFCENVLAPAAGSTDVIVDGVRHIMAIPTVLQLTQGHSSRVLYVDANENTQRKVLAERGVDADLDDAIINSPNEAEVGLVKSIADFIVSSGQAATDTAEEIAFALAATTARDIAQLVSSVSRATGLTVHDLQPVLAQPDTPKRERLQMMGLVVDLLAPMLPPSSLRQWLMSPKPELAAESPLSELLMADAEAAFFSAKRFVSQS